MDQQKLFISKLGSSASYINQLDKQTIQKNHFLNDNYELECLKNGIDSLKKYNPDSIQIPLSFHVEEIKDENKFIKLIYTQKIITPWLEKEWMTGKQLYHLGLKILEQQAILIENESCFVDARPDNYCLTTNNPKLVDLCSIKPLNKQNLMSFEFDFNNYILNPLFLEKHLSIPISNYFQGKLYACNINLFKVLNIWKSKTYLTELLKKNLIDFISNKISNSSPEFADYLNKTSTNNELNPNSLYCKSLLNKQIKLLNKVKPKENINTNWDEYVDFHEREYNLSKIKLIEKFAKKHFKKTNVIDLGANLTSLKIKEIKIRVDQDPSITSSIWSSCKEGDIVMNLDIANALCFPNENNFKALNLYGTAKAAVMTSLIHHLIIDCGLSINQFFESLSLLYDDILLEFPSKEDPMVRLLKKKKNEYINWIWQRDHLPICQKWFNVSNSIEISETRFIVELKAKNNNK